MAWKEDISLYTKQSDKRVSMETTFTAPKSALVQYVPLCMYVLWMWFVTVGHVCVCTLVFLSLDYEIIEIKLNDPMKLRSVKYSQA